MKKIIFQISVFLCISLIIIRSDSVIHYTHNAMILCYELIVPTLFPFFVCSGLLIYSGFGSVMARLSAGFMRPLFNVSPSGAAAFSLGIISGFPLGAVTTTQLYRCGAVSKSEAERLLSFCNNSGPLFIIGSVGTAIYSKLSYGIILYVVHIISSIFVGVIFRGYHKSKHIAPPHRLDTYDLSISDVFSTAINNAAKNMITVCFSIIFFASVSSTLLELFNPPPLLDALVSGLCEFSTGTIKTSILDTELYKKLIITSFIIGFSGLSVHLQVAAVTAKSGLSLKPYIAGKILHGLISGVITAVIFKLMPISMSTFSSGTNALTVSFTAVPVYIAIAISLIIIIHLINKLSSFS